MLTCDTYFESFRHFGDYDVLAVKSVLLDQHNVVAQTGSTALLARTGSTAPGLADVVRDITMRRYSPASSRRHPQYAVASAVADHVFPVPSEANTPHHSRFRGPRGRQAAITRFRTQRALSTGYRRRQPAPSSSSDT